MCIVVSFFFFFLKIHGFRMAGGFFFFAVVSGCFEQWGFIDAVGARLNMPEWPRGGVLAFLAGQVLDRGGT